MAHVGVLIALLIITPKIEQKYRQTLSETMDSINKLSENEKEFKIKCELMHGLTIVFECCGAKGPFDFVPKEKAQQCCKDSTLTKGCADASVDWIKNVSTKLLVIPLAVILFVELVLIVIVPFAIRDISQRQAPPLVWAQAFPDKNV